jgi:hypothetical protein
VGGIQQNPSNHHLPIIHILHPKTGACTPSLYPQVPTAYTSASHHTPIRLAGMQIRNTKAYPLPIDCHITLNKPLIPHLAIIRLSPKAYLDLRIGGELHRVLHLTLAMTPQNQHRQKREGKHTLSGNKMGNQEIISLLLFSMVTGFVLSSTGPSDPLYSTVSKYAPRP